MPLATCNHLWRQFCGVFRKGLYEKRDLNRYIMSDWRGDLDSSYLGNQNVVFDIDNEKINNQVLNVYLTLHKLKNTRIMTLSSLKKLC